jgi:hypothetical protein
VVLEPKKFGNHWITVTLDNYNFVFTIILKDEPEIYEYLPNNECSNDIAIILFSRYIEVKVVLTYSPQKRSQTFVKEFLHTFGNPATFMATPQHLINASATTSVSTPNPLIK